MQLNEYQKLAARTCPELGKGDYLDRDMLHMNLGIFTEIGEVLDILKKNMAYGKPIDLVHLGEEIADACWYAINKLRIEEVTEFSQLPTEGSNEPLSVSVIYSLLKDPRIDSVSLIWRLNGIAISYGLSLPKLLDQNIEKLRVRFPDKFDKERALNRDLEAERKTLV